MSHENRFGALHVRVAGHDRVAGGFGLFDERAGPGGESCNNLVNLAADIKTQIGCDLLVAATPGVQLEAERANVLDQLYFDEVMDVFGGGMIGDERLSVFRRV